MLKHQSLHSCMQSQCGQSLRLTCAVPLWVCLPIFPIVMMSILGRQKEVGSSSGLLKTKHEIFSKGFKASLHTLMFVSVQDLCVEDLIGMPVCFGYFIIQVDGERCHSMYALILIIKVKTLTVVAIQSSLCLDGAPSVHGTPDFLKNETSR